jgi:hypothetical protein
VFVVVVIPRPVTSRLVAFAPASEARTTRPSRNIVVNASDELPSPGAPATVLLVRLFVADGTLGLSTGLVARKFVATITGPGMGAHVVGVHGVGWSESHFIPLSRGQLVAVVPEGLCHSPDQDAAQVVRPNDVGNAVYVATANGVCVCHNLFPICLISTGE